jgi:CheY-like chemotaxis protein
MILTKDKLIKLSKFPEKDFEDTEFDQLMQKRIYKVLLICNNYDNFMLEEDGRIDEQLFNEYTALGLRYAPVFIRVNTVEDAFFQLESDDIDLIITMLNISNANAFDLSKQIKNQFSRIPIVVLTPFSREISILIEKEDLSAIDYVFCWLGNPDLLLAIIKLIEDNMNAAHDVGEKGVQTVILVENSIRYYSSFLPILYKIFVTQSKNAATEGANEHKKNLRMRGRPKILLATNYNEAISLYKKYKTNLLAVFSDVRYDIDNKMVKDAGIQLCRNILKEDKTIPFLLLSSEKDNRKNADELGVGFINKYAKDFSFEIRNFIIKNLFLGSFHFYCPEKNKIVSTASNLKAFQELIRSVSEKSIEYHVERNHITKWLNARSFFLLAKRFKNLTSDNFSNTEEIKQFIFNTISNYRLSKGRGVITKFEQNNFDNYSIFSRIGDGSIGGKARGLAFTDFMIKKYNFRNKYEDVTITIPRTVILCTDIFDEFMETNNLYEIASSDMSDEKILKHFVDARLPNRIHASLYSFISYTKNPIAVRSSSKLEDSHYQPFAGVYSTYMIPNIPNNKQLTIQYLTEAIKSVYASVFYQDSKSYMAATSNVIDEEKMGVILQDVCGNSYGDRFYPNFSGVARSINFYPIKPEKAEDGIANVALGLGKHIVDGGKNIRFSPKYPEKVLQLSSPEMTMKDTQKYFFALKIDENSFTPSTSETINMIKQKVDEAHKDGALRLIGSTYDFKNNMVKDGLHYEGKKIVTFANILKNNAFPLAEIIKDFMKIARKEMNNHIEIEFAVNLNSDKKGDGNAIFNMLQIRPIIESDQETNIEIDETAIKNAILYSESVLGNGAYKDLHDIVYVKTDGFNSLKNSEVVAHIDRLNKEFVEKKRNYILVGPGRWGSSDAALGIPVKWSQISMARVIVESGLENYRIDPSQGTHFFHNLTSFRVGYMTINPFINDGVYDVEYLNGKEAVYEDEFLRHVRFDKALEIVLDGKQSKGIIYKDGFGDAE